MRVLIIGTGYVGLNTGVALACLGHQVCCLDSNNRKIADLNSGILPIYEPHLDEVFAQSRTHLRFCDNFHEAGVAESDVIFITVGTPSLPDGSANMQYVQQVAEGIAHELGSNFTVIVNKSTVPIGSGSWVEDVIHKACGSGARHKDFCVVSNPEFLAQGNAMHDSFYPDRIILGTDDARAIQRLEELFRPLIAQDFTPPVGLPRPQGLQSVPLIVCDLASAEMIKYASNAFLALKISYINEIARLAEKTGADITSVARGVGLDTRIGPRFLNAGIGWGGSCFGKDTAALVATAEGYGLEMPIVRAARAVNYAQRGYMVDALQSLLEGRLQGRQVTMLGFSFKPNTDDLRDAPSIDIARELLSRGAVVRVHDPIALRRARLEYGDLGLIFFDDPDEALRGAEGILLVTEHALYRDLNWQAITPVPLVDGRNFLDTHTLRALGFLVRGVGRPDLG